MWPGEYGRADQEMILAARRSARGGRRRVELPLSLDPGEEEAFDSSFEERFGVNPRPDTRADLDQLLKINFKAR